MAILSVLDADGNCPWAEKRARKPVFKHSISCWKAMTGMWPCEIFLVCKGLHLIAMVSILQRVFGVHSALAYRIGAAGGPTIHSEDLAPLKMT